MIALGYPFVTEQDANLAPGARAAALRGPRRQAAVCTSATSRTSRHSAASWASRSVAPSPSSARRRASTVPGQLAIPREALRLAGLDGVPAVGGVAHQHVAPAVREGHLQRLVPGRVALGVEQDEAAVAGQVVLAVVVELGGLLGSEVLRPEPEQRVVPASTGRRRPPAPAPPTRPPDSCGCIRNDRSGGASSRPNGCRRR